MSARNSDYRRSRSRSRERDKRSNRESSRTNKQERREEMKKENSANAVWGNIAKEEDEQHEKDKLNVPAAEKEKANFGLSGALAKDEVTGNMYNGELNWRNQYRPISMIPQPAHRT
jgi:smad nuclear-interacting protein 1